MFNEDKRRFTERLNLVYAYTPVFTREGKKTPIEVYGGEEEPNKIMCSCLFLIRFILKYTLGLTKEQAVEYGMDFFEDFRLKQYLKRGYIFLPTLKKGITVPLHNAEDIIEYAYSEGHPNEMMELYEKIAARGDGRNKKLKDSIRKLKEVIRN